jgi:hypothetical protein
MSQPVLPDRLDQYPGYFPAKLPPWRRRWVQVLTASLAGFVLGIGLGATPSTSAGQQISLAQANAMARHAVAKERMAARAQLLQARVEVRQVRAHARNRIKSIRAQGRRAQAAAVAAAVSKARAPSSASAGVGGASAASSSGGGLDPRFSYCYQAIAAGYGPYYEGQDPEYYWYTDADGDGVVCEH